MLETRSEAAEIMDDPALPQAVYKAVLADLARVNRVTLASGPTLAFLSRHSRKRSAFSLLDVGYGQGDMLRTIARWSGKQGVTAKLTGIDLNPNSEAIARAATDPALPITYRTGDYAALAGCGFDFIISSLVAHHMTRAELIAFLRFMDAEAEAGWFINDLHRHTLSFLGYPLLARLAGWHEIVRKDGQLSIARSFRRAEWEDLLAEAGISGATITRHFPFRLCVAKIR